jgi:hypothetical protein
MISWVLEFLDGLLGLLPWSARKKDRRRELELSVRNLIRVRAVIDSVKFLADFTGLRRLPAAR